MAWVLRAVRLKASGRKRSAQVVQVFAFAGLLRVFLMGVQAENPRGTSGHRAIDPPLIISLC
eukprot:4446076-Pyramimonas_sp.AAC.1